MSVVQDVKTAAEDVKAQVIGQPASTAQPVATTVQPVGVGPQIAAPPGAPTGGMWIEEKYRGTMSCLACLFVPLCGMCMMCCCPIDKRTVYVVGESKYNQMGAIVS